jgi:hypothetical protein
MIGVLAASSRQKSYDSRREISDYHMHALTITLFKKQKFLAFSECSSQGETAVSEGRESAWDG